MSTIKTPQEVAVLLHCRVRTVYQLIRKGYLKAFRINRQIRIFEDDIHLFLDEQKQRTNI